MWPKNMIKALLNLVNTYLNDRILLTLRALKSYAKVQGKFVDEPYDPITFLH